MSRPVRQWSVFLLGVAAAVAVGVMVLLALGLPISAHAEDAPALTKREAEVLCGPDKCLIARADLEALAAGNALMEAMLAQAQAEAEKLRAELSRIREIKGGGRLEVRPKPPPPGERPA